MEKTLFGVRAKYFQNIGWVSTIVNVVAEDMNEAIEIVKENEDYKLYDEKIQREIANDEIKERLIERNYSDYIYEQEVLE